MKLPRAFKTSMAAVLSAALLATVLPATPALAAAPAPATSAVQAQALAVNSGLQIAAKKIQRNPSKDDVFVNKKYPLSPVKYAPKTVAVKGTNVRLKSSAAKAYTKMAKAAAKDGVKIRAVSGYRSYNRQAELFNYYTRIYGKSYASRISAVPGTSEHQTGLAIDVGNANGACGLQACFANTPVGKWVGKNAHKYGFIMRYQKGQESVTGYSYEPWHFRYLGTSLAKSVKNSGAKSLEAYYGVSGKKAKSTPKQTKGTARTTANLNMRTGAGAGNRLLLTIPKGKSVQLTGSKKSGWYQVRYSSKTGWVSGKYLKNNSMPAAPKKDSKKSSPEKSTSNAKSAKTTANLNMRAGAGTSHRVVLTIPNGKKVAIRGAKKSGWYPVKYAGKNGWVSGTYLSNFSSSGTAPKTTKPKSSKSSSKKTIANLNMRSGAGTGKRVILTIPKGKTVTIRGSKKSGWYPVKYAGKNGWVSGTYLR
ncbi:MULTISPECIES: D-alanyl-D-alanine carboxypeptidase family protein [Micrococcaceae]|uniref:D-alanyl-D-alanine carboxypeptidase family protein n=1 Tax=Micrococcaceae TaxID=1268 RepID=UPI00105E6953|nr:D-alanyl-D-alanine carboxypeptidase family protein [Arthrobacter sp. JUb115]TDU22403.1 D-alanyl-D-alanine carboxypeptidase [Arthrobacter sp. JUb115]